ncbi:AKH_1a_G0013990.mRNA.1.CDS.1 [Saccharomyces cerevisiae]|nr:CEQ_1a_G0013220.mRNA.1.CDS.1 [Saccharomyces cerevisiae]CAI4403143.1 CNB_1a_G0014300.mRNA.1.CDS.1 [Saccharomyces cerevisiae]CAI4426737.1 AKH_1a_G0013990.mRNA.1.CDS.1 [Saccharomyces cerevisiae]CAI5283605.1 CNT_HP2_G0014180.mRNA.1.CDS.1 [Saccharomyces cerevisiae]CAI6541213.1 CNT_HP1_G0012840.mRNA.1.CDS.1 [Saccharomyces cerevisiae]
MALNDNPIPKSVPLHPKSGKYFHNLHARDLSNIYQQCYKQIDETINQLVDSTSPSTIGIEEQVADITSIYKLLSTYESESNSFDEHIKYLKKNFKQSSDACPQIDLSTWDKYRTGELTAPKLSELYLNMPTPEPATMVNNTDTLKILKVLPYIWNDPTCVIPDLQNPADEDDLQIEGGKIELTCPITCKPYEAPLISRKCNHVFDRDGIQNYLQGYTTRDCPQAACSQVVSMRDFVRDPIMELRCKIAKMKESQEQDKRSSQAIDVL